MCVLSRIQRTSSIGANRILQRTSSIGANRILQRTSSIGANRILQRTSSIGANRDMSYLTQNFFYRGENFDPPIFGEKVVYWHV